MSVPLRLALAVFQVAVAMFMVAMAWRAHENLKAMRELNNRPHCIKAYEGMTLEPGQCAYIEIPIPGYTPPAVAPLPGGDKL